MIKKSVLFFLCFTLFFSIPGCKKKLPTTPDIPELVAPTIESFYAYPTAIRLGDASTLSWSTSNATSVFINMLTGNLPATGTLDIYPEETTTYVLSAKNDIGVKLSSCTVEVKTEDWAILVAGTIPINPIFKWYEGNTCDADFAITMREENGVGGKLDYVQIYGWENEWSTCSMLHFYGGEFSPYGSFTTDKKWVHFWCRAVKFNIVLRGVDMNGYAIDLSVWYIITWTTQTSGVATYLETVPGPNHHKLIN